MACYYPITAYYSKDVNPSGKRSLVTNPRMALQPDSPVRLPCGRCIGCRLENSRQWACRIMHEASLYTENCFITLTYAPEHLPSGRSLDLRDFQLFMKRLRKRFSQRVRFFHCGEYGEQLGRPHYHAILFNLDFADKVQVCGGENPLYESRILQELWPYGLSRIGTVTFESAAYVARYITKKRTGELASDHYSYVDCGTGELFQQKPEYATMSRRPGIGREWFNRFSSDVYPKDSFHINGKEVRPPRFYDKQFELIDPATMDDIRCRRDRAARRAASDNSYERLTVKRICQEARLKQLKRRFEDEG